MTFIGKLFVVGNTVLSLLLGTWAMSLFLNRIDWSDNPAKEGNPPGELVRRKALIDDGWKLIASADPGLTAARNYLLTVENGGAANSYGREENRQFYQAELQFLKNGATADNPARMIQLDEKLRPVFDDNLTPRPKMVKAQDAAKKDLLSVEAYAKLEKDQFTALENEQKRVMAAIELDTQLSGLLIGPMGLHQLVVDERDKNEKLAKELSQANRPLTNTRIELQMMSKRGQQLEARLAELKKARDGQFTGIGQ